LIEAAIPSGIRQPGAWPTCAMLLPHARAANPEGGRSDTLGVGAGPASGRIRSPAIVPAGIATPKARDPHLLWAQRYQDRCPASELTQPAGGQAARPSAGAWLPGSWEALFKGSGSDLRELR
jgi:hypothetical protein